MNLNSKTQPCWQPISDLTVPSGYTASAQIQSKRTKQNSQDNFDSLCKLAAKIKHDPLQKRLLADRVYQLMQQDLRQQQERSRNYGGLF